jgi:hypothetical protein
MTVGVWRPTVILPRRMGEEWPLEDLEPVLLHELAHIRRLDLVVNWVQMAVQLVYFFHPLVWYVNRRIRYERELICDDLAVGQAAEHRAIYCRSILRLIEETQGHGLLAGSGIGMVESHGTLGRRIMRIMDHGYRGHRQSGRLGAAFLVVLGAFCVALASEQAPMNPTAGDTPDAETRRVGEAVRQRLTTYSDEQKFIPDLRPRAGRSRPAVQRPRGLRLCLACGSRGCRFRDKRPSRTWTYNSQGQVASSWRDA